jgi:hypothetical protein
VYGAVAPWAYGAGLSFSIWWHGEASHELGVHSADVSALPGVLPQSSRSPASYQSPWIMEVRRSVAVFWWPSWIPCLFNRIVVLGILTFQHFKFSILISQDCDVWDLDFRDFDALGFQYLGLCVHERIFWNYGPKPVFTLTKKRQANTQQWGVL